MALRVEISVAALGPPQDCSAQALRQHAQQANSIHFNRPNNVGLTQPTLRVGCHNTFEEALSWGGRRQLRVSSSILHLRLSQTVYLLETLPQPVKGVWLRHELVHVLDNESIVRTELEPALRRNEFIRTLLAEGTHWFDDTPATRQEYLDEIVPTVQMVFQRLTMAAAQRRDTPAEYARFDELASWVMGAAPATPSRQPAHGRQHPQRQGP